MTEYRTPLSRSTPESRARFHRVFADQPIWTPTIRERLAKLFSPARDMRRRVAATREGV